MLEAAEEALAIVIDRSRISLLAVMKDIEIIGEAASRIWRVASIRASRSVGGHCQHAESLDPCLLRCGTRDRLGDGEARLAGTGSAN